MVQTITTPSSSQISSFMSELLKVFMSVTHCACSGDRNRLKQLEPEHGEAIHGGRDHEDGQRPRPGGVAPHGQVGPFDEGEGGYARRPLPSEHRSQNRRGIEK